MIELNDFVTLYNGHSGIVVKKDYDNYMLTISSEGLKIDYHLVNVRTINGVIVYQEDLAM